LHECIRREEFISVILNELTILSCLGELSKKVKLKMVITQRWIICEPIVKNEWVIHSWLIQHSRFRVLIKKVSYLEFILIFIAHQIERWSQADGDQGPSYQIDGIMNEHFADVNKLSNDPLEYLMLTY
jgi:hypothetical protein